MPKKIIVGMSGSSGAIIGIRLLEALAKEGHESHLVITETAGQIIEHETEYSVDQAAELASESYSLKDLFAPIASGSFRTDGMVVAPCSMKTLAGIASGYSDNLLLRAADVCLKERRPLVLIARETPLSSIHLENMQRVTSAGAVVLPPVLSFYSEPKSIDDLVNHIVGKALDALGIENEHYERWG